MKPDWDSLMEEYKGHESKLIADVDCTSAGKPLCDSNGIKGFPSIKYGDPSDMQDYKGGRDLKSLKEHAEKKLVPMCSPAKLDLCDDEKKAQIIKFQAMSADDLEKLIEEEGGKIKEAEKTFEESVKELQSTYEGLQKAKEEAIEAVNAAGLGIMKAVKASAGKGKKDEL
jgi:DNA phosphorothioation-dependent restriction protein DptG